MRARKQTVGAIVGMIFCAWASGRAAQPPQVQPEDLGLLLPTGVPARSVDDQRVLLTIDDGEGRQDDAGADQKLTTAKVYLEVGDRLVVVLPNGALRSVQRRDVIQTDRPFAQPDKDAVVQELASQFPNFRIRETKRYVFVYSTSQPFYQATSRILETMHPKLVSYCRRRGLGADPPDTPLVVVMFRTEAEFQQYRQMPESILAYYNTVSNRIVLYEQSELTEVAPAIAVKQAISTIAHEGVHQILHNIGVQHRLSTWPAWISEGLPEYFAPTSTAKGVKWKGVGLPNDLRIRELIELGKKRPPDAAAGDLVRQVVQAERLQSTGYAVAWALTHFLATTRREDFQQYLREVSEIQPLTATTDELARFTRHFGDDWRTLELQMIRHVRGLPYADPMANQPHYLVVAATRARQLAVLTSSPLAVRQSRRQMLAQFPLAERGRVRFTISAFPNQIQARRAMQAVTPNR